MEVMFYIILLVIWVVLIHSLVNTYNIKDRASERHAIEQWYGVSFVVCGSLVFILLLIIFNS